MGKKENVRYFNTGPWPVYIGFTTSERAFEAELKRLKVKDEVKFITKSAATHYFESDGDLCCIITAIPFNLKKHTKEGYAALIAHEATHVVQEMREDLAGGKPLGGEAEAYLIQQIVQESLQTAWKSRKRRRTSP